MTRNVQTKEQKAISSRRHWVMPAVVFGLLGGHVTFIVTAITLATGEASFAVVPDYYQKAVSYDERKALLAQSDELGWQIDLTPSDQVDTDGQRKLILQLRNAQGSPIEGMAVSIDGYHLARADQPLSMSCAEVLPGQYIGVGPITKEGYWRFAIDVSSSDEKLFVADMEFYIATTEEPS